MSINLGWKNSSFCKPNSKYIIHHTDTQENITNEIVLMWPILGKLFNQNYVYWKIYKDTNGGWLSINNLRFYIQWTQ